MKIISWNVNSLRVRLDSLLGLIQSEQPDIIALQEIKVVDQDFPSAVFEELGYYACFSGQKTYNGVAILSRAVPCTNIVKDLPNFQDEQRRVLAATWEGYRIVNLYIPNGSELTSEKYQYKLNWLEACKAFLKQELAVHPQMIVLGDFNIAPTDQDVWDPKKWKDCVLVSEPERAAFREFLDVGLVDLFRHCTADAVEFSWWDYRAASFRRNQGLRIDHILASKELAPRCSGCWMVKEVRGHERPSDHAPVVAEFH